MSSLNLFPVPITLRDVNSGFSSRGYRVGYRLSRYCSVAIFPTAMSGGRASVVHSLSHNNAYTWESASTTG